MNHEKMQQLFDLYDYFLDHEEYMIQPMLLTLLGMYMTTLEEGTQTIMLDSNGHEALPEGMILYTTHEKTKTLVMDIAKHISENAWNVHNDGFEVWDENKEYSSGDLVVHKARLYKYDKVMINGEKNMAFIPIKK